ncbi:MAG: hypothetical protein Q7V31_12075 [Parvibaculum sp.]|uniref:hypothetical protein n=1 Tax=Parvibaculum sp. TaxID=2024848 RepID=UPI002725D5BC|nr:hypothetical protein [Parvibaculum sp.]MDO8839654.1 hypothetical protein [Parvibaculum sp.]
MVIEGLIASVVLPAAIDLFKGLGGAVARRVGGISTDDQLKLDSAHVERLKALAVLDNPHGVPSQWVVDLRASFRYVAAAAIIAIGSAVLAAGITASNNEVIILGVQLAGYPFGFIFGERMYLSFKGALSK